MVGTSTPSTITGTGSIETLLPFSFDPGGIIINGNQTITSQLAFNYGKIHTVGASKIIIGNGAFVINGDATRYVDGNLEYYFTGSLGLTYNIGDVNKYLPVQFTPASKSEASQFNVIKNPDSVAPEVPIVHVLLTDFVGTIPEELI